MFSRKRVEDAGDTNLADGMVVDDTPVGRREQKNQRPQAARLPKPSRSFSASPRYRCLARASSRPLHSSTPLASSSATQFAAPKTICRSHGKRHHRPSHSRRHRLSRLSKGGNDRKSKTKGDDNTVDFKAKDQIHSFSGLFLDFPVLCLAPKARRVRRRRIQKKYLVFCLWYTISQ